MCAPEPASAVIAPDVLAALLEGSRRAFALLFAVPPQVSTWRASERVGPAAREINVMVGFSGCVSGQLMLGMGSAQAVAIAGVLVGARRDAFDEVASSAIAELGHVTAGSCAAELARHGIAAGITAPSVITGPSTIVSWPHLQLHEATVGLPYGEIALALGLGQALVPAG